MLTTGLCGGDSESTGLRFSELSLVASSMGNDRSRLERESPTDQQCKHCGLYFSKEGIHNHQRFCWLIDVDTRVQPLEDGVAEKLEEEQAPESAESSEDAMPSPGEAL